MTTPTKEEAGAIVRGLSEPMRAVLIGPVRYSFGQTLICQGTMAQQSALNRRGILVDASLTPLGLAVRAFLKDQANAD
jgi:hypothetical protein